MHRSGLLRAISSAPVGAAVLLATAAAGVPDEATATARRLGEDFAGGFYERDPQKALANLHPALSKLGVTPNIRRSGRDGVLSLPPGALEIFALQHNADGHLDPATAPKEVTVLDATDDVVVFRLKAAEDWYDIWLAAKIGDDWRLINCVFGAVTDLAPAPGAEETDAVATATRRFGEAVMRGDADGAIAAAHLDFARRSLSTKKPKRLLQENRETLALDVRPSRKSQPVDVTVLAVTKTAAAAKIRRAGISEWVFLLKLDGAWRPVNSFWQASSG